MSGRAPTAQELALAGLRTALRERTLVPGEQIRQESVAAALGVSRVPLREALKVLEGEGLVVHAPHRGYFVADLGLDDLRELYRIRDLLESEAARCAIAAMDDASVRRVADLATRWESAAKADDLPRMTRVNRDLHFAILEPCGSERLLRLIAQLWDASDAYRAAYYVDPQARKAARDEHRRVLDAVRRRDADALVLELRRHREHAVQRLAETLGRSETLG